MSTSSADPDEAPVVAFKAVGKRFAGNPENDGWVLRGVDLALPTERTTAIVGPSGCGKTTLMQLVNAVYRPDEGSVRVLGEAVPTTGVELFRRRIGYAVQGAGLFPHLTIAENADLPARIARWDPAATTARRQELFALAGLPEGLEDRYPHQLSGGQRQRVGLCRALMLRPPLLLLDEPFSAIDPVTRAEIYQQFERLREHERTSILLVTHDMREALRLADYLVVMGDGGIVQADATDAVAAAPASDFVRTMLAIAA